MNKQQSGIPFNALLRLVFSEEIHWLAFEENAAQEVEWVTTHLNPDATKEALIVSVKDYGKASVLQAKKDGAVAVIVVGDKGPSVDLKQLLIPCAFVHTNLEIPAIQRELLAVLLNKETAALKRSKQIHEQLTRLSANNVQLDGLARAMQELTGRSILIQDKRLQILADAPSPSLQSIWIDIQDQLNTAASLPDSLQNRKLNTQQNIVITQSLPGGIERMITPIITGEVARGYLSIIGMTNLLDPLDKIVATEGALVCAVEMAHNKALREKEKFLQSDLLTALLQEDISPRDAELWVDAMGLDPEQAHCALQFSWDSDAPPSQRRLETLINGEVAKQGLKVIVNPTGNTVICFCQIPPDAKRPDLAIALGQRVMAQAEVEYGASVHGLRCGIGGAVITLNDWHQTFSEAGQALKMAFLLKENRPLYYPDLSLYRLLLMLEDTSELGTFHQDILGTLLAQKEYKTFIETLEAYFEQRTNISQTARALFIHRNTLTYRLERIKEITGLNLDDPETMLTLQLALKIHAMKFK